MRERMARLVVAGTALLIVIGVVVFASLRTRSVDPDVADEDPQRWAALYPHHYAMTMRTQEDYGRTRFGGSTQYDKLAANPFRRRAFAGHPFATDYRAARGHFYSQIDQRDSRRTQEHPQPAACLHCHAAEAPRLVEELGWDGFHRLSYDDLKDRVHHGTSCTDCHAPDTMALRVNRPAFLRGLEQRGIEISQATRQEMRTLVCAQCHLEYYFRGEIRELVPPWDHGTGIDEIERHYDDRAFTDWVHAETGAPMIKMQHPEYELYSAGTHARLGVACADCHMPRTTAGGLQLTDHWVRSPLTNVQNACMNCHQGTAADLTARSEGIQERTTEHLKMVERAIGDLMDAIVAAREAGASDEALREARHLHRRSQLRWDFVDAENSTGFHAAHETTRILLDALDHARQGERSARAAKPAKGR